MIWIKPSFLSMMYRSGRGTKPGQEHVLANRITRVGFEDALSSASLSHFDPNVNSAHAESQEREATSPVRVQWDPERDLTLNPLPWRSLQVGLTGSAVDQYLHDWIVTIDDITTRVHEIRHSADPSLLPDEQACPPSRNPAKVIGATR